MNQAKDDSTPHSEGAPIRVLLVEDHCVVRQGIRHLLELDEGIKVVGEAETGEDAVEQALHKHPDVVLMDIRIPGKDGIQATKEIKKACPHIDVIVLSSYADQYETEAMEAGASACLTKSIGYNGLSEAIRVARPRITGGGICPGTASRQRRAKPSASRHEQVLSEREIELLRCLASGIDSREIRKHLSISEPALRRCMRSIFDKLGVGNRTHALGEAYRRRLL
jgi:DNA-binding NarL/FixJ family response regulator